MNFPKINTRLIPYKYRVFFLPLVVVIFITILSLTVAKSMVLNIVKYKGELDSQALKIEILQNKVQVLNSLNIEEIKSQAAIALNAIPTKGSSLNSLATIRALAVQRGVFISDFRINEESLKSNETGINAQISLYGSKDAVLEFLREIEIYAPLTKILDLNLSANQGGAQAKINYISIWSPTPLKIKDDEALEPFGDFEKQSLKTFENLKRFGESGFIQQGDSSRNNPFSF